MTPHRARPGVLPSQMILEAIKHAWIASSDGTEIPDENVQPASLDLRLGSIAHRLRCSFLPGSERVEEALLRYKGDRVTSLRQGLVLEPGRPYLIPLLERLDLPEGMRAKSNPKSSTGRLDIFTRVITDNSFMFDEIPAGYHGPLYLEIVSRTFPVRIWPNLSLNQLRLMVGRTTLSDDEILRLHSMTPLLFRDGSPLQPNQIAVSNGLFMALDLGKRTGHQLVGYRAKDDSTVIDLGKISAYRAQDFWEDVISEPSEHGARIILRPERFYLLLSLDSVKIPPGYAAEMTAIEPTSGELRTHYAGFFDPGFGYDSNLHAHPGSRAALEVRAHDVPFAVEHAQNICRLSFDVMTEAPDRLYGTALASNYQGQEIALSKHFKRTKQDQTAQREVQCDRDQLSLFPIEEALTKADASLPPGPARAP